jgi:ABC-type nitrate/sulfonate/bicarbonate transport system substrate-binding protein
MKSPKQFILLMITLLGIMLMVLASLSCSNKSYSGPVESITLGTLPLETSTLIFIAEDQQFFTRYGLKIDYKYFDTGLNTLNGLLNKEVDIAAPVGEYAMVGKILSKENIQAIGSIDKANYQSIIGRRDRGISTPSDLKGNKIGVILGTQQEFYVVRFLELNGIQARDTTFVNITLAQAVNAIVSGDVAAVVTPPPYTDSILNNLGSNAVTWSVQSNQLTQQLMICRNEWIMQHPVLIERFIKSLAEAQDYLNQHPPEARAIVRKKLSLTDGEISRVWSQNQFSLSLDQSLIIAMEDEARWMMQNNLTPERQMPDFRKYIYVDGLKAVKPEVVNIR